MASHFLLSAKACTLSLASVLRMTDTQAEQALAGVRWPETDGKPMRGVNCIFVVAPRMAGPVTLALGPLDD